MNAMASIPGITFRHTIADDDYAAMVAVRVLSAPHDGIDPRSSREHLPTEASLRDNFPANEAGENPDLLLVEAGERVVGNAHTAWRWIESTGTHVHLHLGYLLPEFRGRGIGSAMLSWSERRIRDLAAADGSLDHAVFATNASTTESESTALIVDNGYREVRRLTDMAATVAPMSPRNLPPGVETRPVTPAHYRPIYAALKDSQRGTPLSTPENDGDYDSFLGEFVRTGGYDPALWHIAWSRDEVVGLIITLIAGDVGHVTEVGVRQAWWRRGIAASLLTAAMETLALRGIHHARLFTNAANPRGARTLYERFGFAEVKQHVLYRKLLTP